MATRRSFLRGLIATSICPAPSWANAGSPAYLSAARKPNGDYALFGLTEDGHAIFEIPLPDRGHAAAAHPHRPIAVAFARRPGTFAIVLDCVKGQEVNRLRAPKGRHFYGHGAFSADGSRLFTTENDYENAEGIVGVWDVESGYTRMGEFPSGGVGPHELRLMPDGKSLVIANGGIETHPDSGREKLNIPLMQPNLSYVSLNGDLQETKELPRSMRLASIRHLAVRADGLVAIGCQWQGANTNLSLVATHKRGEALRPLVGPEAFDVEGYIGSIAFSKDGTEILATSPRGGLALLHSLRTNSTKGFSFSDVCGAATAANGIALTTGSGQFLTLQNKSAKQEVFQKVAWDNHLIALTS